MTGNDANGLGGGGGLQRGGTAGPLLVWLGDDVDEEEVDVDNGVCGDGFRFMSTYSPPTFPGNRVAAPNKSYTLIKFPKYNR